MKEIRFKFWNSKKKVMYMDSPSFAIDCEGDVSEIKDYVEWAGTYYSQHIIPILHTGLKDKNNTDVYEFDIYINHDNNCIGILLYDEYGLWATEYKNGQIYNNRPFRDLDTTNFEVIGNKYENPDLLNNERR